MRRNWNEKKTFAVVAAAEPKTGAGFGYAFYNHLLK